MIQRFEACASRLQAADLQALSCADAVRVLQRPAVSVPRGSGWRAAHGGASAFITLMLRLGITDKFEKVSYAGGTGARALPEKERSMAPIQRVLIIDDD